MKKIGSGKFGTAFKLENGNVLKITRDFGEFDLANDILAEKASPYVAKHSCKILKVEETKNGYEIEKEFVNVVPGFDEHSNNVKNHPKTELQKKAAAWFSDVYSDLCGFGIHLTDLSYNIGQREDGTFCFFDMMYNDVNRDWNE